jgi:hypothetical protein
MVSSGKGAARKLLHGRILLQADASPEGMRYADEAIAEALGVRGYPETFSHCRNEIKQPPCGNETRGDRRERVCSA